MNVSRVLKGMTTGYAPSDGVPPLKSRFGRDMARLRSEQCSPYVARLLAELNEVEKFISEHWDELDAPTRVALHALVLGVEPNGRRRPALHRAISWLGELGDHVQMAWALVFDRPNVVQYYTRSYGVAALIQEKVGRDVWAKALASPEDVAAADRGIADALAGRTVEITKV
jgi:hypothetical protein